MARSTLNDFVVKDRLGTGSYGAVYKVIRKVDRQPYALKEVDLQGMTRKEQEECIKETQILSSLDSPYITRYYDSFLEKGKLYICMEYAAGGNLHDFIKSQPSKLPENVIWRLFIQMLLGLNHMHKRKVLHRDFKTLNVFLDDQLNVRLGDLGVAKILSSNTAFAQTMVGTPYYLSPEMCEDKPYDAKSDVWALGVSLYECCTQKHPFDADNQGALILKILRGKYPAVSGYSKELIDIVKACLTLDARKRPDTKQLLCLKAVREGAAGLGMDDQLPSAPQGGKAVNLGLAATAPEALSGGLAAASSAAAEKGRKLPIPAGPTRPSIKANSSMKVKSEISTKDLASAAAAAPPAQQAAAGGPGIAASRTGSRVLQSDSKSRLDAMTDGQPALVAAGRAVSRNPSISPRNRQEAIPDIGVGSAPTMPTGSIGSNGSNNRQADAATGRVSPEPGTHVKVCTGASDASAGQQLEGLLVADVSGVHNGGPATVLSPEPSDAVIADDRQRELSSPARHQQLEEALAALKQSIIQQVGARSFEALRVVMNMTAAEQDDAYASDEEGSLEEQQGSQLVQAVERIVPQSKVAAVLPLLFKLMYLEGQAGE